MRRICAYFVLTVGFLFPPAALAQTIDDVVIPSKTDIFVVILREIDTRVARQGDRFHAEVEVPVTLDDNIIIPPGSYVLGTVDFSKRPGRLKGKSQLRLIFDTIILPDGVTRKVEAFVQSAEGQQRVGEDGTLQGKGSQGSDIAGPAAGGAVTGGIVGAISGRDLKGAGIGAAIGAGAGAIIGALKKGDHVVLRRGSSVTIQLDTPVRFVKPEPRPQGKKLTP